MGDVIMPLPLGHAAIGLSTYSLCSRNNQVKDRLKIIILITLLSNLPDIDVLIGLVFQGNGNVFHRGPTHSMLFALLTGYLASNAYKVWAKIPKLNFRICFLVILSHIVGDSLLTNSPISFFWPFEVNCVSGYSGWFDVMNSVLLETLQDTVVIIGCIMTVLLNRFITHCRRHFAELLRAIWPYRVLKN
jgi:membrane-bound metal-dependent hydrolase YbcI (DUF457 family)